MSRTLPTVRSLLVLLGLLCALALPACGGGGDGGSDGGSGGGERGEVEGTGYTLDVPAGWEDATSRASELGFAGFQPDVVLVGKQVEGFRPSVNVVLESSLSPDVELGDYVEAGRQVLRRGRLGGQRIPGEDVELGEVRDAGVDGERAASFEHERSIEGRRLRARQIVVLRESSAYTITYTALADRFDAGLRELDRVVASWRWE
jgi:hypothetical protein